MALKNYKPTSPARRGLILIDKTQKFQQELGQWTNPEAFLKV